MKDKTKDTILDVAKQLTSNYEKQEVASAAMKTKLPDVEVVYSMIDDLRKVANTTNDPSLLTKISEFEQHIAELLKQKEEAERKKKEAEAKAAEAEEKRKEEEKRRKTAFQQSFSLCTSLRRCIIQHLSVRFQQ